MEYSHKEEIVNAITHGIGALLSIAALVLLIVFSSLYGSPWHIVSFTIFGTSLVLLYVFSTLLHSFKEGVTKNVFEVLDHSAIYLLIAGSYTPFVLVTLRGPLGWTLFGIIWGLAVIGIVFKVFFVKRFIIMSTIFYVLMGWMIMIGIKPLYENMMLNGFIWLVLGGILYTAGTIFYVWRKFPYHHAVWHLFVLAGSVSHFFAVLYLLPDLL
ncbi:PAQR family membrane homeostasis protein TrhA [Chengkuizengella sediminis]|uniref:PAQR family membrane homeostasis protein TrhA n=1 Tax=Chengkuizengella sediminis TaxID=1885917 RepID=UPI001389F06E|nr:hemolysin III family protein [Chengkuizengella sediminis]NDI36140.1 hemolysin III family protein [Chengkuizengella sediminis]